MDNNRPTCYTVKDIQQILSVSRPVVYDLLRKEYFRVLKIGEKYIVPRETFDAWLLGKNN